MWWFIGGAVLLIILIISEIRYRKQRGKPPRDLEDEYRRFPPDW
jgi:hypothetical protein